MFYKVLPIFIVFLKASFAHDAAECDIEALKESCHSSADQAMSCTFVLYDSKSCETACECGSIGEDHYVNFCNIEEYKKGCQNTADAICNFEIVDVESCNVGCSCVSANPPYVCPETCESANGEICEQVPTPGGLCPFDCVCTRVDLPDNVCPTSCENFPGAICTRYDTPEGPCPFECGCVSENPPSVDCPTDCPSNENMICQKISTEEGPCPFACGCVDANPSSISCENYLSADRKTCENQSGGKRTCRYEINLDDCTGKCVCEKRKRCFPL